MEDAPRIPTLVVKAVLSSSTHAIDLNTTTKTSLDESKTVFAHANDKMRLQSLVDEEVASTLVHNGNDKIKVEAQPTML
jgi:hypothetical protein